MEVVSNNGVAEFNFFKSSGLAFYICLAIVSVAFILTFLLAIFKRNYVFKKRVCFSIFSFGACLILLGYQVVTRGSIGYAVTLLGCAVVFSAIIFSVRVREKTRKQERDFIKFIDGQISAQKEEKKPLLTSVEKPPVIDNEKGNNTQKTKAKIKAKTPVLDVDFTHVKKVMERLSFVSLSPTDKRQIKELENAISSAECGQIDELTKAKINDGLSALLKIMAKYGI